MATGAKQAGGKSGRAKGHANLKKGHAPGVRVGGRQKGTPNKATVEFRQTVRQLLEDNSANVGKWLSQVANGVPVLDESGKPIPGKWVVEPDPDKALQRLTGLAEYSAPKLARTEVVGDPDAPVTVANARQLTDADLIAMINKLGK